MRIPPFSKTRMLTPTTDERLTANPAVVFSLFLIVNSLLSLSRSGVYQLAVSLWPRRVSFTDSMLIQLGATLVPILGVLLYCMLVERRTLVSLGFSGRGAPLEYGLGLLGGVGLFGGGVLLCVVTGTMRVDPTATAPSWGLLALFLVGFMIQGMSEEMLCRSYLMVSVARGWPLWAAATLNSLLFSLLHLGNSNVSVIALINIFLFGLFASLLTLRRGSIWMVGALHSAWNFAQGNLFGIPVSGIRGLPSPLVSTPSQGGWQTLINGGLFGLEGGLAATVILLAACAVTLLCPTKRSELA